MLNLSPHLKQVDTQSAYIESTANAIAALGDFLSVVPEGALLEPHTINSFSYLLKLIANDMFNNSEQGLDYIKNSVTNDDGSLLEGVQS